MKKRDILSAIQLLLAPVLVILLGLLLLINPDSASVLLSKLVGSLLVLVAAVFGIAALFSEQRKVLKLVLAALVLNCGILLTRNPLLWPPSPAGWWVFCCLWTGWGMFSMPTAGECAF